MAALPTSEAKRLESVGSRTGGFDLMGAVRVRSRHANHGTQTVWVCVPRFVGIVIKWMQVCADGASPPPTWGFVPAVCRCTDSGSFSSSADGKKPPLCKGRWHGIRRDGGIVNSRPQTKPISNLHFSGRRGRRPLRSNRNSSADGAEIEPFICGRI